MRLDTTLTLSLALALVPLQGSGGEDRPRAVVETCALCHGLNGDSTSPQFPRLAAQPTAYIEAQLKAFRNHSRADPPAQAYMWGMTAELDDDAIHRIALYFASRPAPALRSPPAPDPLGRQIFEVGLPEQGVPACASCHTESSASGARAARLSGQHPEYLMRQLGYFKAHLRITDAAMVLVCSKLTVDQMRSVALYAASR